MNYIFRVNGGIGSGGDVNLSGGYGSSQQTLNESMTSPSIGGDSMMGRGGMLNPATHKSPVGYGAGGYGNVSGSAASDGTPGIVIVYY